MFEWGTSDQPGGGLGRTRGHVNARRPPTDDVRDEVHNGRRSVGLAAGVFVLATAGLFAACAFRASSPEDVVGDFFAALEDEDILGAVGSILPSEHRFIIEPLLGGLDEATRLGILTDVDLEDLQGVEIEFGMLTYEVEELADDLVWVAVSGDASLGVRPEDLPVGSLLSHFLPANWAEDVEESPAPSPIEEGFGLAVVKQDGDWYVSLAHTIAESARRESGVAFPTDLPFEEPGGAATPEEALERAALAFTRLDLRALIDVLVPAETAAFRRYAQLFIDDWDSGVSDFRRGMDQAGFSYSVDEIVASSASEGDDMVAWIEDVPTFSVLMEVPDVGTLSIARSDGCLTADIPPSLLEALPPFFGKGEFDLSQFDGENCISADGNPDAGQSDLGQGEIFREAPIFGPLLERWFESLERLGEAGPSAVQFQVEEIDDRWYLSMAGTINRWILAFSKTLDEELLTRVGDELQRSIEDPEAFEQAMQDWLSEVAAAGLLGPIDEPLFGPEILAPFAGRANVLLVSDVDTEFVVGQIDATYGSGVVVEVIDGTELHEIFLTVFGSEATGGLAPDQFPDGILIAPVDVDTLVGIFNWPEILDMFRAADLGLGSAGGRLVTGEAEVIAALTAGCEDGDYIMCDVLYQAAPFDSELETYADTCGNRTSGEGFCATEFDVDIDLDALETECLAGDMFSCDQLYIYTPIGSVEEEIGRSCGGLERESRTCVVDHGLDLG
jgi:hypothetical protein